MYKPVPPCSSYLQLTLLHRAIRKYSNAEKILHSQHFPNHNSDCHCLASWIYISISSSEGRISSPRSVKKIANDGDRPEKFRWKKIKPGLGRMIG